MADTLRGIRKALEMLTDAYKRILKVGSKITDYQKLEEMDDRLKGKASVLRVEDFIIGEPTFSKKDITPSSISSTTGTAKTGVPFVISASKLRIFKNSEKYVIQAKFVVKSAVFPPFVQVLVKNLTTDTVLEKSEEVLATKTDIMIEFTYYEKDDEEISFLFDIGGNVDCEVEWRSITFYKLEPQYTNEQKSIGEALLTEHVKPKHPFFNAIRNKRGSLSLPLAEADDEAVPLKQVDDKLSKIHNNITTERSERVSADTTEKEERIAGDAERYTKSETDSKLQDIKGRSLTKSIDGNIAIGVDIKSQGVYTGEAWTTLQVYADINSKVDNLSSKISSLEGKSGVSSDDVNKKIEDYFRKLFSNGYVQYNGIDDSPEKVFHWAATYSYFHKYYWEFQRNTSIGKLWCLKSANIQGPPFFYGPSSVSNASPSQISRNSIQ